MASPISLLPPHFRRIIRAAIEACYQDDGWDFGYHLHMSTRRHFRMDESPPDRLEDLVDVLASYMATIEVMRELRIMTHVQPTPQRIRDALGEGRGKMTSEQRMAVLENLLKITADLA